MGGVYVSAKNIKVEVNLIPNSERFYKAIDIYVNSVIKRVCELQKNERLVSKPQK